MSTKIRSSQQLYIDENLQFNSKKGVGLAPATSAGEAVEFAQMQAAINNAVSGAGNSIHEPVADLAAAKAVGNTDVIVDGIVTVAGKTDKMLMLIETLGLYHYDADSLSASNDITIIRPTDVATDAAAGRWIKMSSILTDHALLDNILGNGGYHLSQAERDKLTGIEGGADITDATNVGAAIAGTTAAGALSDTDFVPVVTGSTLGKATFTLVKSFLKTYFDTLYNKYVHPNHTGDVTSVADGATTIAANAVSNTKLADMATGTIKGRATAATGDPEDLTKAQVLGIINVTEGANPTNATNVAGAISGTSDDTTLADADLVPLVSGGALGKFTFTTLKSFLRIYFDTLYNNYLHPNHTGDVTSVGGGAQTIAANAVTNAKAAQMPASTIKGNNTGATANQADLTAAQVRALINVADGANAYTHPNHSGDVTSVGDGVQTIAAKAVTLAKMADMATDSFLGRDTAGTGAPEVLSVATVKTLLGLNTNNQSSRFYRATPAGLVNGSNTQFTIAANVLPGTEDVYKNGLLMNAGAGNDYTIAYGATTTITFLTAPSGTPFADIILVNYSV